MFRFACLALFLASAQAFTNPAPAFVARQVAPSSTARPVILSEEEIDSIMQSAADCAGGECSLDDVSELIFELKQQQKIMQDRLDKTMNMISDLQHLNQNTSPKDRGEVKAFIKDMLRVFAHEKPTIKAVGYSGDVGEGAKTAWDALPPKKWTPKE